MPSVNHARSPLLGDLANDMGRPDDAIDLAEQARECAGSVQPPLRMWIAYATRTIGRAKVELRHPDAQHVLEEARALFEQIGNQLGEALVRWDMAHLAVSHDKLDAAVVFAFSLRCIVVGRARSHEPRRPSAARCARCDVR